LSGKDASKRPPLEYYGRRGWKGSMTNLRAVRVLAGVSGLLIASLGLSGCVSPTYGTGETAAEQLMDDLGAAASIGSPASNDKAKIKYAPRPGLVVAKGEEQLALVQPQASLADKNSGQWVESPEEIRARLVQEAEENQNTPGYNSPIAHPSDSTNKQMAAFREARKVQQGNYNGRRFLSDPPTTYREADPAQLTDLGEPEKAKERRRKKAAATATGSKWWMPFQ
jgi:hypothetical protein